MKFTIRKAEYYKVMVSNKPGAAAKVFVALMEARVNLLGFSGFPRAGHAQLNFIPGDPAAFKKALRKAGVSPGRGKFAFLIQGPDRPGAAWDVVAKLSEAKINVVASHAAVAGSGRYGAILWVKPGDVAKTAKLLGAP
jgi:hypothetical protein